MKGQAQRRRQIWSPLRPKYGIGLKYLQHLWLFAKSPWEVVLACFEEQSLTVGWFDVAGQVIS